jgi:hypothetical protein
MALVVEVDVGDLKGDSYERRVRERAPSLLNRVAGGMRRIRVLDTDGLADTLDDAVDSGSINADERDDLLRADCVARAVSRETAETVYLVVEASVSLANDDMKRAARRAELASRALGATAIPVVVAASQSKAVRAGLAEKPLRIPLRTKALSLSPVVTARAADVDRLPWRNFVGDLGGL